MITQIRDASYSHAGDSPWQVVVVRDTHGIQTAAFLKTVSGNPRPQAPGLRRHHLETSRLMCSLVRARPLMGDGGEQAGAAFKWIADRRLNSLTLSHSRYICTRTAPGP